MSKRRVNVNAIDEIWAADSIDTQEFANDSNGIKFLITVIDIFSKFVWNIPLKRKTGQEVANAFSRILKERRHSKMWVDGRCEFYHKTYENDMSSILRKTKKNLV